MPKTTATSKALSRPRKPFGQATLPPAPKENINEEIVSRSVTKNDHLVDVRRNGAGSIFYFNIPAQGYGGMGIYTGNSQLPAYWSHMRDRVLRASIFYNGTWANAVNMWLSKIASQNWELKGIRIQRFQELLLNGWGTFIQKLGRDFTSTDNGCFFEIVRASNAAGSRVLGIVPLDSIRCTRTGDPDYPVVYMDWQGHLHALASYEVCMMADMTSPADIYYGTGVCAATRSFDYIVTLQSIEQLVQEKASGSEPTGISFVNASINEEQLQDTVNASKEARVAKGYMRYMGVVIVPLVNLDANPTIATIPLKSLPEGYKAEEERENCQRNFALSLGLDPQLVNPRLIGSGSRGTSAQSTVLREEQQGTLPSFFKKELTHLLNRYVLPNAITFYFGVRDLSEDLKDAQIKKLHAETRKLQIESGEIDSKIAREVAVEEDELSPRYIEKDTLDQPLSDTDQPTEVKVELSQPVDKVEAQPDATLETKEYVPPQWLLTAIERAKGLDEESQAAIKQWEDVLSQAKQVDAASLLVAQEKVRAQELYKTNGHHK